LKADGSMLFYDAGPDDRPRATKGAWKASGESRIEMKRDASSPGEVFVIQSCDAEALQLRRA
jgi:hypothetical protein